MLRLMPAEPAIPLDRRQRRRQETIEEVLDHAVEIMVEQGVAGLSIGEIARRMGIRPPSLYVYFPSKHALYDALFARGAESVLASFEHLDERGGLDGNDLAQILLGYGEQFLRWAMDNQAYSQLLFWRPVPGFAPTPAAYEPAVALRDNARERFEALQKRGLIRPDADVTEALRDWTILTAGVLSQQLSNAPEETFDSGRFTAALPSVVAMFVARYGAPAPTRRGHAGKR